MPLTPEEVRAKQFATVRMRTGYDMEEVDAFLDEVEAELARLATENEQLRQEALAAKRALAEAQERALSAPPPPPAAPVAVAPPPPPPGEQALKIIEMAQRTAEGAVADARAQADRIVAQAAAEADELTARTEAERNAVERRVAELRAFEREYRARLRTYLQAQLSELDGQPTAPAGPAGGHVPPAAPTLAKAAPPPPVGAAPVSAPPPPPAQARVEQP